VEHGGDRVRHVFVVQRERDLIDPAFGDQPISAIASRWGLPSAPHFSRLFRKAYGCSPREFRRSGLVAGGVDSSGANGEPAGVGASWPLDYGYGESWAATRL
jgi:hypothetical protein